MRVGVISDTHGLLRPEAVEALRGVDHILHAGDIGKAAVVEGLGQIAPVTAIRGNVDEGSQLAIFPETETVTLEDLRFHLVHAIGDLAIDPVAEGIDAVVFGHSHKPSVETCDGVLRLNPGSAGPRRFRLPVTLARLRLEKGDLRAEIVTLLD